jgi:hypothetical protein
MHPVGQLHGATVHDHGETPTWLSEKLERDNFEVHGAGSPAGLDEGRDQAAEGDAERGGEEVVDGAEGHGVVPGWWWLC